MTAVAEGAASSSTASGGSARAVQFMALAAPAVAVAICQQIVFGAFGDVSWLITVCERWLDGHTPYVDIIETNPPAAILVYMPPVFLARLLHIRPEFAVAAYGLSIACALLAYLRNAIETAKLAPAEKQGWLVVASVALTVLPGRTFDERDFFSLLAGLPFVFLWAARAQGAKPEIWRIVLGGLSLAAMIVLKPPYATIPLVLAPYLFLRVGVWGALGTAESYIGALLAALYGYWVFREFPAYVHDIVPTITLAYLPVRESVGELIANAGVVTTLALGALTVVLAGEKFDKPIVAVPALASLGALGAFFVQGKGWLYHAYPALALMSLALAGAAPPWTDDRPGWRAAAAIAALTLLMVASFDLGPLPVAVLLVLGGRVALAQLSGAKGAIRLMLLASGGLIGAGCGYYSVSFPGPTKAFANAVRALGPHPRIASLGEGLGIGFPLTRNVDGVWTMRTQGLLMTAGARWLHDMNPTDLELADRLDAVIAADVKTAAQDIEREKPDALLVSRKGPRFHAWLLAEPRLAAARADYVFVMSNPDPAWPVDLFVRADKTGMRGPLKEP